MKYLLITITLFFQCALCCAQQTDYAQSKNSSPPQTTNSISISTDAMQYPFFQPNLNVEYTYHQFAIGFYAGIIFPNGLFSINPLANGQYKWPGSVYHGSAFKYYFKYYSKPNSYWCLQYIHKSLWYNNVRFTDYTEDARVDYTISETAAVSGFDFLKGYQWGKGAFDLDFFWGIGFHNRQRDYEVTSSTTTYNFPQPPYVGFYSTSLFLPTPVVGLKIGFNYLFKKKPTD